jgi:hypothetical protein
MIVWSWGKQTIQILEAAEFFNCVVAQYHACSTHCKVGIREMHTPVSTLAFVSYAMDKMLLETVSQNPDEIIGFDLLLLTYCHHCIQVFKVKQHTRFAWAGGTCPRFTWAGGTFFPVVLLCQFLVWREIGFGCTYYYVLGVP